MQFPLCESFGFDAETRRQRLHWLGFSAADHALARRLQEVVIAPNVDAIVDAFYAQLDRIDEARALLGHFDRAALEHTQRDYLTSLGAEFDDGAYFESRLRVGLAHAHVGLSLSLYHCAYFWMCQLILARFPEDLWQPGGEGRALELFLRRIISLDISLAIETYHQSRVDTLEATLAHARLEHADLREAANIDALTGVATRKAILAELAKALQAVTDDRRNAAAVMVDVDHFKQINDTYGHLVGDKVLAEVAQRVRTALRGQDNLGRYGGEEFLVILKDAGGDLPRLVAERIRCHVGDHPISLEDDRLEVTLSLGVSQSRPEDSLESVIQRADAALYAAKAGGRNRVVVD